MEEKRDQQGGEQGKQDGRCAGLGDKHRNTLPVDFFCSGSRSE